MKEEDTQTKRTNKPATIDRAIWINDQNRILKQASANTDREGAREEGENQTREGK